MPQTFQRKLHQTAETTKQAHTHTDHTSKKPYLKSTARALAVAGKPTKAENTRLARDIEPSQPKRFEKFANTLGHSFRKIFPPPHGPLHSALLPPVSV